MKKKRLLLLITGGMLLFPSIGLAQVNCIVDRPVFSKNITIQAPDITVGADVAVGTVIYTGFVSNTGEPEGGSGMTCRRDAGESYTIDMSSSLSGGGAAVISDNIFSTNIPGIGVRLRNIFAVSDKTYLDKSSRRYMYSLPVPNAICVYDGCRLAPNTAFWFELIKTGSIEGGYIFAGSFPQFLVTASTATPGVFVSPDVIANVYFSGGVNIKQATCQTPGDFTVNLGKYDVTEIQKKGASPFVDATITLTGCPQFTGMPGANYSQWDYPTSTPSMTATNRSNIMEVTLTPLNAIRSATNGTFLIDSGNGSASGVDIQVYYGTIYSGTPMRLSQPVSTYLPTDGRSVVTFPMAARYLKNSDKLSPGAANGKMVYTINYK